MRKHDCRHVKIHVSVIGVTYSQARYITVGRDLSLSLSLFALLTLRTSSDSNAFFLALQSYLFQMIKGLEFCHARGVMHR